ncbi:MAG: hypothetical protein OHK0029_15020 [Armatimonadaceae bacterium]
MHFPSKRRFFVSLALVAALTASAADAPAQPPKNPKVAPGTVGTSQLAGTDAKIGTIYSLKGGTYLPSFNFTLLEAAYSVERVNIGNDSYYPQGDEKLLVLKYQLQNPQKKDIRIPVYALTRRLFQAVAEDNQTYDAVKTDKAGVLDGAYDPLKPLSHENLLLKPSQKSPIFLSVIRVPAKGVVPKLIVQSGRVGTNEEVLRYDLRGKVKPLPAPYGDPADSNGADVRDPVPGEIGKEYVLGRSNFTLDKIEYVMEPFGKAKLRDGEHLLVGTGTMRYMDARSGMVFNSSENFAITLEDTDGEKMNYRDRFYLPTRDTRVDATRYNPGDTRKFRFYFVLPKDARGKILTVTNTKLGDKTGRSVQYDLSQMP